MNKKELQEKRETAVVSATTAIFNTFTKWQTAENTLLMGSQEWSYCQDVMSYLKRAYEMAQSLEREMGL